jgi:type I restriction-modification system DNA methylase subunit
LEQALKVNSGTAFEYGLKQLDMMIPEQPESSGLVFVDRPPSNPYEHIALEDAAKYEVDAVYFRRFDDGRPPIPQIYIYDNTETEKDEDEVADLHRRLWNSGQVPLFFIFTATEVKIFNCHSQSAFDEERGKVIYSPLETINLAAQVQKDIEKLKEFSAKKFDNGSFWETYKHRDEFKLSESVYETLLQHLKEIKREIVSQDLLPKSTVQKLLVMSILVKYLEERHDQQGNTVFPQDFFGRFAPGANHFVDVLKQPGACLKLFDYLSEHFNGEIFKWDDAAEREKLECTDLEPFSVFLEARTEITGQRTFWRLYSFNDLPIELISNIYEEFLEARAKEGVVYTPPYLVHFLIDEAMPISEPKTDFKILDPACGSGIFLVAAYRRLIYWWRISHNRSKPDLQVMKQLLRDNIYGTDKDPEAVRLTIFSLSLVIFDELSPRIIWEELKFDNLKERGNIFNRDFFELIDSHQISEDFDLVIGNPPFIKLNTPAARKIESEMKKERVNIPGDKVALLFLEQAIMNVCKPAGLMTLILPSGPFLYNKNSFEFRKYFLQKYDVKQILDFTSLHAILFGSADVATLAVFARKREPSSKNLLHVTVRRTKPAREKIYFELDRYDFNYISYKEAINNKEIWKVNFLGGGRLKHLTSRLSSMRKFEDYLKKKVNNDGWFVSEGYIIGNRKEIEKLKQLQKKVGNLSDSEYKEYEKLNRKYHKAGYLTGSRTLPTRALTGKGIIESEIHSLRAEYFTCKRKKEIFSGPLVLIRELAGKETIPIAFRNDDLSFGHQIIGIHAPVEQVEELKTIEKRIKNNKVYLFCVAIFSGRYLINKATSILKWDIDNLPYPEDESELDLSEIEKILMDDVMNYILEFYGKSENPKAVKDVGHRELARFGDTYCKVLNSVYKDFRPYVPVVTDSFICFPFYVGDPPQLDIEDQAKFEDNIHRLVHQKMGTNLRVVRVLRIYNGNVIYLIKPKQMRYWLRSVAVRDADETFADLLKQGY